MKVAQSLASMIGLPGLPLLPTTAQCITSSTLPGVWVMPRAVNLNSEFGSMITLGGAIMKVGGAGCGSPFLGGATEVFIHIIVCAFRPRFSSVKSLEHTRCEKVSPKSSFSRAMSHTIVEPTPVADSSTTRSGASVICRMRSSVARTVSYMHTERSSSRVSPGARLPLGAATEKSDAAPFRSKAFCLPPVDASGGEFDGGADGVADEVDAEGAGRRALDSHVHRDGHGPEAHRCEGELDIRIPLLVNHAFIWLDAVVADGSGRLILGHELKLRFDRRLVEYTDGARVTMPTEAVAKVDDGLLSRNARQHIIGKDGQGE
eukprot:scaffold247535_cov28-Tisochrysis_lutea.AAC.3